MSWKSKLFKRKKKRLTPFHIFTKVEDDGSYRHITLDEHYLKYQRLYYMDGDQDIELIKLVEHDGRIKWAAVEKGSWEYLEEEE